jgi:hypothetical protein
MFINNINVNFVKINCTLYFLILKIFNLQYTDNRVLIFNILIFLPLAKIVNSSLGNYSVSQHSVRFRLSRCIACHQLCRVSQRWPLVWRLLQQVHLSFDWPSAGSALLDWRDLQAPDSKVTANAVIGRGGQGAGSRAAAVAVHLVRVARARPVSRPLVQRPATARPGSSRREPPGHQ